MQTSRSSTRIRPTPLWTSLIEFQALAIGPLSFVANVRPSSVVSFVASLDPSVWAVQAHAGNGIVRAHALGEWTLEQALDEIAHDFDAQPLPTAAT